VTWDGGPGQELAYVDDRPAGWVNASLRADYSLHPGEDDDPPGTEVVGVSCFIVAPPYRRHGLAAALLDRVLADAPERGAVWVEAYPFTEDREGDGGQLPWAPIDVRRTWLRGGANRAQDTVVRRRV
jgi:GNAT superfamily N-acetyltransferase